MEQSTEALQGGVGAGVREDRVLGEGGQSMCGGCRCKTSRTEELKTVCAVEDARDGVCAEEARVVDEDAPSFAFPGRLVVVDFVVNALAPP